MPDTFPIFINPSPADSLPIQYARVTIPLAKGACRNAPSVRLSDEAGALLPVQLETLARWPDNSVRAVHATFPAKGGTLQVEVSGSEGQSPNATVIVLERRSDGAIAVSNGRMQAIVGGPGLVQEISLDGRQFIGRDGIEVITVDGTGRTFKATAALDVETAVEIEGPLRCVIAVRGKCSVTGENSTFLDFRLRFEFLAGVEGFSLSYTFFNLERGQDFFDVRVIELELKLSDGAGAAHTVFQQSHGLFSTEGRLVSTTAPLHVAVDDTKARAYVTNFDALEDAVDYPFYLNPPPDSVDNWAAIGDDSQSMVVEMDDFHLLRPKSLDLEGDTARFGVWPRQAGTLSLQQGRSRQVTVRVALSDKPAPNDPKQYTSAISQLRDTLRATLPREVFADANFFDQARVLPFEPDKHPRFERWLAAMAEGTNTVATFFDLGDTPDSGYQRTYIPIGNRIRRVRGEDGGQRWFTVSLHYPAHHLNGLDDFEPVWVNNEYDVIYALGTEFLRTGNLSLFQKLRWWSRHTIDVDFLHYSDHKWLHRAQPAHSERHTTTGAYPSHFWTQGLAQYYMLTGDPDALEVVVALADKTIENLDDPVLSQLFSGLNREIGWGILTMICAYEASGIKRFDDYARELLDREIAEDLPLDLPVFSFGHTSILLGAREYLQIHEGDPHAEPVRRWLLEFVDLAIRSAKGPPEASPSGAKPGDYSYDIVQEARGRAYIRQARSGIFSPASIALDPFAYAYEITGDEGYIKAGLRSVEAMLDSEVFRTPPHEGKLFTMVYRTFVNYLKAAAELGYLEEFEFKR